MAFISVVRFFVMLFAFILLVFEFFSIKNKMNKNKVFVIRLVGTIVMAIVFCGMIVFKPTRIYGAGSTFALSMVVVTIIAVAMIIIAIVDFCTDNAKGKSR